MVCRLHGFTLSLSFPCQCGQFLGSWPWTWQHQHLHIAANFLSFICMCFICLAIYLFLIFFTPFLFTDICKTTQSFCYLPIFFLAYMHHLFPLYFHNLSLIQHRLLPQYSFVVLLFQQNHFYFLLNTLPPFGQKHKDFKLSVQLEILPSLPVLHIAIYL